VSFSPSNIVEFRMAEPAITVRGLRKTYGQNEAVRGIDFEVARGQVFGFLGPNGAGKTTTIEILEGYRARSVGEVSVLGLDPGSPTPEWRRRIGLVLQECELDPLLTVRETMTLFSSFYPKPREVGETIQMVGLGEKGDARVGSLSGGQRRRLDVGVGIIGDPELLFLDEPTTGFDPSARRDAWNMIEGLRELGTTVVLTTHYMDEAQRLADRVAIIAGGEVVARGTPEDLGDRESRPARITYREGGREVELETTTPVRTLNELTGKALAEGRELEGLEVTRPSLEDVYLELTDQP
jgi:ABC-2 type transport system ATP-binding protein